MFNKYTKQVTKSHHIQPRVNTQASYRSNKEKYQYRDKTTVKLPTIPKGANINNLSIDVTMQKKSKEKKEEKSSHLIQLSYKKRISKNVRQNKEDSAERKDVAISDERYRKEIVDSSRPVRHLLRGPDSNSQRLELNMDQSTRLDKPQKSTVLGLKQKLKTLENLQSEFISTKFCSNFSPKANSININNQFFNCSENDFTQFSPTKRKNNSPEKALIRGLKIGRLRSGLPQHKDITSSSDNLSPQKQTVQEKTQNYNQFFQKPYLNINIIKCNEKILEKGSIFNCVDGFTTFGPKDVV